MKMLTFSWPPAGCGETRQVVLRRGSINLDRKCGASGRVVDWKPAFRVSSKQTKIYFGLNRNKPKQDLFRVFFGLFRETKTKNFGLIWCFESISKQAKQTELFRNKPKQTETTLNVQKNTQIYSPLNCLGGSPVCFSSIKTSKLHRNCLFRRYRSETTETNCFETNRKNRKNEKN